MIEFTQSSDGSIYGYDEDDVSQALALSRIENDGHIEYQFPVSSLAEMTATERLSKWSEIKAERDRRTETGGFFVSGKWFHSDQKSRTQQLGLVMLGSTIPSGLQWKTMDGSFVTMTPSLAQQILTAGATSDQAIFAAAEAHKSAMELSASPSLYDYSGGWPLSYDESSTTL
jgi:Domain of unknown function (DUF4376)